MATTPNLALPYPAAGDAPDGPGAIYALAKKADDLSGWGAIGYAGTVTDFGNGWVSSVRRALGLVSLIIAVNPGANGISGGASNNLIASVGVGFRPINNAPFVAAVYTGSWGGATVHGFIDASGNIRATYSSSGSLPAGSLIAGAVTYPAA